MKHTRTKLIAMACAIANARAARRGRPGVGNSLDVLAYDEREDRMQEAEAVAEMLGRYPQYNPDLCDDAAAALQKARASRRGRPGATTLDVLTFDERELLLDEADAACKAAARFYVAPEHDREAQPDDLLRLLLI